MASNWYVSTKGCAIIVGCSCYIFSSIVIWTPNDNFRVVPLPISASSISVDNMHINYSVFLDILSEVFVGVPQSLQAKSDRVPGNILWMPISVNWHVEHIIITYVFGFITELRRKKRRSHTKKWKWKYSQ